MRNRASEGEGQPTHQFKDLRKIAQGSRLKWRLDQATCEKVHRFHTVLAVTNIASFDVDHAHHRVEHGSSQERTGWETDGDYGATGANIFGRLLEGLFGDGEQKHGMRTETLRSGGFDVGDEVLGLGEIDVCLCKGLELALGAILPRN